MNKTKIEWTDYTWNPVVGCKHGCSYCYAKRMNDRFKWIAQWDYPKFFWERLKEPLKIKKPSKIFVCSVADLFGDWVDTEWITSIIIAVRQCPQHTFQFLTKNPKRYSEFEFPKNCWLGITVESYRETWRIDWLKSKKENKTFISIEPLLSSFNPNVSIYEFSDFKGIDQVIVGAMTGKGAIPPKKEWIKSIKHPNIFYKDNIKKYLKK